jgi:hypothetical protein
MPQKTRKRVSQESEASSKRRPRSLRKALRDELGVHRTILSVEQHGMPWIRERVIGYFYSRFVCPADLDTFGLPGSLTVENSWGGRTGPNQNRTCRVCGPAAETAEGWGVRFPAGETVDTDLRCGNRCDLTFGEFPTLVISHMKQLLPTYAGEATECLFVGGPRVHLDCDAVD